MKIVGVFLCILAVFLIFGMTVPTSMNSSSIYGNDAFVNTTYAPPPPISLNLELSEPPILGKKVEVTFTVSVDELWHGSWDGRLTEDLAQSKAWVQFSWINIHGSYLEALNFKQFSPSELLASNNMSWQGNALENRKIVIESSFQIPDEGIWVINGYFSTSNWRMPEHPGDANWPPVPKPLLTHWVRYGVVEGYAINMTSTYSPDFKDSPLSYLDSSLPWGGGEKTFDNSSDEYKPLIMQLNISKPPRVGEEVSLSCSFVSLYDEHDFSARLLMWKDNTRLRDYEISELFVSGNLIWSGDLKAQTPVMISATIKFPEEGRWHVQIEGTTPERKAKHLLLGDSIEFTIDKDKSYYGITDIENTQVQRGCAGPVNKTDKPIFTANPART